MTSDVIAQFKNVVKEYHTKNGTTIALNGVNLDISRNEFICVVGPSGCGKSTMLNMLAGLFPPTSGQVLFEGKEVEGTSIERGVVFQQYALFPWLTVRKNIEFGLKQIRVIDSNGKKKGLDKKEIDTTVDKYLNLVQLEDFANSYPKQLSGGMKQRVMIAIALVCEPDLIIADEPTTALDVTTQAQIIDLLRRLQEDIKMSVILITHDLGVVAELCRDVAVMYCGRFIEQAAIQDIFDHPRHPYTRALLDSVPDLNQHERGRLLTIEGVVPTFDKLPSGCHFQDRCRYTQSSCRSEKPKLQEINANHYVECLYPLKDKD